METQDNWQIAKGNGQLPWVCLYVSFISYLLHEVVITADQEYVGIFIFSPCERTDF